MRFGEEKGTNPEELIGAAHAGCFSMALAFGLGGGRAQAGGAAHVRRRHDREGRRRLDGEEQRVDAEGQGARHVGGGFQEGRRGGEGRLSDLAAADGRARSRSTRSSLASAYRSCLQNKTPRTCGAFFSIGCAAAYFAARLRPRPPFFAGAAPPCGRGPCAWRDPSAPWRSSARPSDSRAGGPTWRGIRPASCRRCRARWRFSDLNFRPSSSETM